MMGGVSARIGVVSFPGSLDDGDARRAVRLADGEPVSLWHADTDLAGVDAVVLPGGFSYGDYLRCGAIARFAPVMGAVVERAGAGMPVLGICNGFQVLCESHLLPGALVRNANRRFICRDQRLLVETTDTVWTSGFTAGQQIVVPLKNGEGGYVADNEILDRLEGEGRVVFRYLPEGKAGSGSAGTGNPNGSLRDIAGISDPSGRIVGLMPHPEHAVDRLTGPGTDGLTVFASALSALLQTA